jgi:hypothetical protein
MPHDGQKARTYAAEWAWRENEHERESVTSLDQARSVLDVVVPPVLSRRVEVSLLTRLNTNDGGWVDYQGHGQYRLALRLPTLPSIVLHEAAHVLTHATDGRDVHGPEFRETLLWAVRTVKGERSAHRLARAFEREGL